MQTGWLTHAGPYKVEHMPMPRPGLPVDLAHPPLGLIHTTQGPTIEGALSVFRQHYAPTFTVGVDAKRRGRLVQHVPLGEMAAALMNAAGGVETNRVVRVQIEVVGYALNTVWLPSEPTRSMLVALLAELEHAAGIPLRHPIVVRDPVKWRAASGWVGHVDAPENDHVDPGKLNYRRLFQLAGEELELGAQVRPKPRKHLPVISKTAALKRRAKKTPPHPLCGLHAREL